MSQAPPAAPAAPAPRPWTDADRALLGAIYDLQCTSRMNAIFYENRLARLMTIAFWMEVVTAATASGSGLLAVLNEAPGGWGNAAWQTLALTAALVAIVKPIYAPGKKIEVFTRQQQGYHANFFALRKLAFTLRQTGAVADEHRRFYDTIFDRHVQLSTEDENAPNPMLLKRARDQTASENPPDNFWWPDAPADAPPPPPSPGADVIQLKSS